ncbi:MAG TPA: transposase [Pyrinomonadaceae bacterium]|nr:transposase [Pyrinomonadaceae bacterium]
MTRLPQTLYSSLGWHNRGYLPHFNGGELAQFITFRLHDALPRSVLVRWREELKNGKPGEAEAIMRRRVEAYLDQGHGVCYLKDSRVAAIVQNALLFHDQTKYRLVAWVIMPNHAHMLCTPRFGHNLAEIMHLLKSYTSNEANKILSRKGRFWQKEYFDRYIRNVRHYSKVLAYIENNPVKARLCEKPEEWPFSSARFRNC